MIAMTALAGYGFFCKPKVLVAGMKDESPMSTPDQLKTTHLQLGPCACNLRQILVAGLLAQAWLLVCCNLQP